MSRAYRQSWASEMEICSTAAQTLQTETDTKTLGHTASQSPPLHPVPLHPYAPYSCALSPPYLECYPNRRLLLHLMLRAYNDQFTICMFSMQLSKRVAGACAISCCGWGICCCSAALVLHGLPCAPGTIGATPDQHSPQCAAPY